MREIFVSTAVTLSGIDDTGYPGETKALAGITPEEATKLIRKQVTLIALGERAEVNQVHALSKCSGHFANVQRSARAVGMLVPEIHLRSSDSNRAPNDPCIDAKLFPYGAHFSLDPRDMLYSDTWWKGAVGSCFLVEDQKVITARHVFKDSGARQALENGSLRVVFGYQFTHSNRPRDIFCKGIDYFDVKAMNWPPPWKGDWIALELTDCATQGGRREKLAVSPDAPAAGTPVYSLGHPNHASLRYVKTSLPLELSADQFGAYLDAYDVSSGSPVFSADSHAVIGLVRASFQSTGRIPVIGGPLNISPLCLPEYSKATLCVYSAAFAGKY